MWLVTTELEGSTDSALENLSSMSLYCSLFHLHFLSLHKPTCQSPNRASVCCSGSSTEFHSWPTGVDSNSSPKPIPGLTSSLKPSLTYLSPPHS